MLYLIVKSAHIIAVISWMAGLLYLPRLFVYHAGAKPGSEQSETFKIMEKRLLRAIMNPAMIGVWVFGFWLASLADVWSDTWFHIKLSLILGLTYFHHLLGRWRRDFEKDTNIRSARYYRYANEIPTVTMIGIVIMVVVRPF